MMKFMAFAFAGVFSVSAFGSPVEILGSSFERRHQQAILEGVAKQCGSFESVSVVDVREEEIRVDQGIVDRLYVTILKLQNSLGAGTYVSYETKVVSRYSDHYDHSAKDWGHYSVESVEECVFVEQYWAPRR